MVILSKSNTHRARFSEIKHQINGISHTMLSTTLKNLERDGMLIRESFPEVPPRVEYQLTELGLSVLDLMEGLVEWVEENWPTVQKSREKFDRAKTN